MERKLRVLHVIVKPVLVWDDGEELTPFEQEMGAVPVSVAELVNMGEQLKAEVAQLNEQFENKTAN